jgi:raffinose/stachyose/melibiose transport system permease protein
VLAAVILIISWHFIPLHTLLYQAGVRQIPRSLYEAAEMDGAGRVQQFFSITLPQLKYTIVTSSTLILVGSLTYFDLVFVLTAGGPGYATRILPLHMYLTGFQATEMGKASAIAAVLAFIGLGLSVALTKLSGFSRMQSQQAGL